MTVLSGGEQPTPKRRSAVRAAFAAIGSLILFVVAFILFMLAPLLMLLIVGFGMYGFQSWSKQRRRPRTITPGTGTVIPPAQRAEGPARDLNPDATPFGFGGVSGEDL